jgi:iron complex outermembrane receptor protein
MPLTKHLPARVLPTLFSLLAFATANGAVAGEAGDATELPTMTVTDETVDPLRFELAPDDTSVARPTTAELLKRTPGGSVNFNGPLSGIVQYRGMYGDRVLTRVDGLDTHSGCPNQMDPALNLAPMHLLEDIEIQRGIAPVSSGYETIGGYVNASTRTSRFTTGEAFEFHGDLSGGAQTADDGYGLGVLASVANADYRFHLSANRDKGGDTEFPGGKIDASEYDRDNYGVGFGLKSGLHRFGLDYFRNDTEDTGTPALPMDVRYEDTDRFSGTYQGLWNGTDVEGKLSYTDVEHEMTNFHLRQAPPPTMQRNSITSAEATDFQVKTLTPVGDGNLGIGADGGFVEHDADIFNPNNATFFVNNYNDVQRDRYSAYVEWDAPITAQASYEIGVRYTRVEMDAGEVDGTPAQMPGGAQKLRDRFNAADRSLSDDNLDLVTKLFYRVSNELRLDLGLGRKTRSPSYQEAYLWLPLESSAGLADGKRYVGNLELKPEVAYELDMGLDWRSGGAYAGPRVFYKRVDDYIQGVPSSDPVVIAVSTANGDPNPLQYDNVEAELYGFDMDFGTRLAEHWRLDGVVSYVRGKRRDIDDNLYRIAPLNGTLALSYERSDWSVTAETVLAAEQDQVSATNEEEATGGYALLNLFGHYRLQKELVFRAGVNNLFDTRYSDHLNGYNRVRDSDVALGERLPGPGRSLFARVHYSW